MACSPAATITSTAPSYTPPTPVAPTGLTVQWGTPTSASSCPGTASWNAVSGAAYYTLNGTNVGNVTSAPITGQPGVSNTVSVCACV